MSININKNIILIGFKNCGKTSIGKLAAEKTHKKFMDTDDLIQQSDADEMSIREIYQHKGERYFRNLEKNMIISLDNVHNSIIATGGGVVLDSENISRLKKLGALIYLEAPWKVLWTRLHLHAMPIPAFVEAAQPEKNFRQLYQQRKNLYQQAADFKIKTDNKSIPVIVKEIIKIIDKID